MIARRIALLLALSLLVTLTLLSPAALAGGLELPDVGTRALGRGGAFTAKADDGTALVYNIGGLARQRGTRLTLDLNVLFHSYTFQRSGVFPDDPTNPATPWGGKPFPLVRDTSAPFPAPTLVLSTDFGYFDRWSFAVGVYGPSSVGQRTYPLGVDGFPAASRYDLVQAAPLVVFPTAAAAVRLAKWLDLGVALHVVVGKMDLTSVSFTDLGPGVCKNPEYQPCDSVNRLDTLGATATASLGILVRPTRYLAFGVNVRGPFTLDTSGTVHATAPAALKMSIAPAPATFSTRFPWVVRAGLRLIAMRGTHESADLEADATYESWGEAQGGGPQIVIPALSLFQNVRPEVVHHYHDTFSVRLGGALHVRLPTGELSFRLGGYYDSSATDPADTRLDFDTLPKLAGTVGIGYAVRGFSIDLAYAYVHEEERTVDNGDIRPIDGAQHGTSNGANGMPLPAVNNGIYRANTQILSIGIGLAWDALLGSRRVVHYRADYEPRAL